MAIDKKKLGYIVGAVALLGFCSSLMREPKASAPATIAQVGAVVEAPKPVRTSVPDLAKQLDAIMRDPTAFASGKDDTGQKTVTYNLKPLDGIGLAYFAGVRGQKKAWRFGLEGMRCDRIDELGIEVVELQRGDGRPLSASWYRIKGGPLEGILVKVFPGESAGLCNVMPGTPPYWEHQGEKTPR